MSKGILQVHPPICDCPGCRISSPVNRGRLADKRTVTLSATRSLKKERTPSFSASDGDSDGSGPTCGRQPGLKREDGPHIHIMKRRYQDPGPAGSVHRSRHLVMPEHQSRCEFQRGSLEIGLGPAGDLLGKRLGHSSHISSDCSSEKRARSQSPQAEALLLPPELGPTMAPEDQYRRLVSALSEAGTFEDPQRLYHLGLPSHGEDPPATIPPHNVATRDGDRARPGLDGPCAGVAVRARRCPASVASFCQPCLLRGPPHLLALRGGGPLCGLPPLVLLYSGPRRAPRKGGPGSASARPGESKEMTGARLWAQDGSEDEPPKDSDGEDPETAAAGCQEPAPGQAPAGGAGAEGKGLFSGCTLPPSLPLGFPYAVSPYFHTGTVGGLSVDGEEAPAPEDVSKWTVDDVCSFVGGLSGCGEYTRVFREQGIDGETLPLLTEEHLLTTMGLKLGPALKIRAQVARRLGRVFYMASFPVALPLQPPTLRAPERELSTGEQPLSPRNATSPYGGGHASASHASPKQENGTLALLPGAPDPPQPLC
uniref:Sterile alpha motif domain containing 11 n=1 Tax=Saimiri boliviensis boliviensis TaxID=39432 RepID=A0A2K6V1A0_SAIBB